MQPTATSSSATASPASGTPPLLRASSDRRAARERRLRPRTPVFAAVTLRLAGGSPPGKLIPAHLVDVSATGVGVRTLCPLAPGTEFTLEVASPLVKSFRYRVARCQQFGNSDFHIGAAFVRAKIVQTSSTTA